MQAWAPELLSVKPLGQEWTEWFLKARNTSTASKVELRCAFKLSGCDCTDQAVGVYTIRIRNERF